ncbi:MAG: NUDIX hydrolase [archaeon]|nr:NUDIX hydrolase [archaeon]
MQKTYSQAKNTADAVILLYEDKEFKTFKGIVLIKRKNPPFKSFWALPGGFLNAGKESLEQCCTREAKEETELDIKIISLIGIYSDPKRDPARGHIITAAYLTEAHGIPEAKDDTEDIKCFRLEDIPWKELAFDHENILKDAKDSISKNS